MTVIDGATEAPDVNELPETLDPYRCAACLAHGDACDFHRGFGEGWDSAVALVAHIVDEERNASMGHVDGFSVEQW